MLAVWLAVFSRKAVALNSETVRRVSEQLTLYVLKTSDLNLWLFTKCKIVQKLKTNSNELWTAYMEQTLVTVPVLKRDWNYLGVLIASYSHVGSFTKRMTWNF